MSKYKLVRELGRNQEGGRITHLATDTSLDPPLNVVIKEFRFAATGANWSGFKAYEREIEILRELEHPRIAKYLDSFETKAGFCLVQEYKNAPSLAEKCSFKPEEIKRIAVSVLEILVYLQKRTPPIIHRDIKPENILVDQQFNAYLIDFGFARIRGGELALSSVAAGTPGFMPPEEQFGRTLTEASDLYSLGATLICLLTGTRSVDIGKLIDDDYRFNFKKLVPQLSPSFIAWLEKMVTPNVKQRYANAVVALDALQPISVVGGATWQESFVGFIKGRKPATVWGLATIGTVAVVLGVRTTLMSSRRGGVVTQVPSRQESLVRQLRQTKQCLGCNLQSADLNAADLNGVDLYSADLQNANLSNANLSNANLQRAQLKNANLSNARLESANLSNARLESANLQRAYVEKVNLKNANLYYANLSGSSMHSGSLESANLINANLTKAILTNTNLQRAQLKDANLQNAKLESADLQNANLRNAKLNKANLTYAKLKSAELQRAELNGADLRRANLDKAKLNGADLSNTSLYDANLTNASLYGANLNGANLDKANLNGADLTNASLYGANLKDADLKSAKLKHAKMPDGSIHP